MAIESGQPRSIRQQLLRGLTSYLRPATLLAFFLFLLIALPHQSRSQQADLVFEDIPLGDGIPTNVQDILQDKTGYLWFATWSGLYKYDGYGFVSYKHHTDDSSSLFDNTLYVLFEDKTGILWIGSDSGLERFDPKLETFTHLTPNPADTGDGNSNRIQAIYENKYGVLWVGSYNGLYKFDRSTREFVLLHHDGTDPESIAGNSVDEINEDKDGTLWLGTGAGLDRLDIETGKFTHSVPTYSVWSLCLDNTGTLWLGGREGLLEFNPKEGTTAKYRVSPDRPEDHIYRVCQDPVTGSLWLGTRFGLFSFNRVSKNARSYSTERVFAICKERSGTLWVGAFTGIKKLNRSAMPFKRYPMSELASVVKEGKEGILWIKVPNGYRKFDVQREEFVPYSFGKDSVVFVFNSGGDLLLYSDTDTLSTLDSSGVRHVWGPCSRAFAYSVSHNWKGKKGFWVGTDLGGLHRIKFEDYRFRETESKNIKLGIRWIYEDSDGTVWLPAARGKLFCYDPARDTITEFTASPNTPSPPPGGRVNDICEDTRGMLWFATTDGLMGLDRQAQRFVRYGEKDGLPSDNIRGVLVDDHGRLWLASNRGISKLVPETGQIRNYDASYGLEPTADALWGKGCKTRDGEMYFGGAKGFTRFHPDSVTDNQFIPPIVITAFRKFDRPSPFSSEMRLPYDEDFLSFEFAALSYISPERNQYAYMLEGLDKDWVYCGTRRFTSYPGLDPGKYVFRVKGSNNDGVWNEVGTSIAITIAPPWWKTTWAYVLYAIVLLSMLYLAWKLQIKRISLAHEVELRRLESERLHEMDELKSRFFTNISHEFRTPLTLILGPLQQIIERTKEADTRDDLRVVHKNAKRLLALVNQLLDISKLESGTTKLQTAPRNIVQLWKALVLSFASHAERKRITLTFNAREDGVVAYIDEDKIEKIVINILSNAIKFTPEGGRIDVVVIKDEAFVNMTVRDTGIGIPQNKMSKIFDRFYQVDGSHTRAQEGTGIGLSLTKELVELHKGTIEAESIEGKGTTFTIRIPLGKEHLKPEEIREAEREGSHLAGKEVPVLPEGEICQEELRAQRPDIGVITEASLSADQTGQPLLLIVEDNSDVRNYIRNSVDQIYRIREAIDGEDGWSKSIVHMPDIIVSDVMMPRMDGFELCQKLKTDQRTSHIPVILLTAKASNADKIEGFDIGADDYIIKPFDAGEVRARIRNLLAQRRRLHEHFRRYGLFEIEEGKITPLDQKFLQKTVAVIAEHMSDAAFGVEVLASEMAVSRSLLLKKIEALIGEPPSELVKRTRLNKAAQLIEGRYGNISEIALEVGFNNPSYFGECFKKQFGCTPSHYHRSYTQH
jgi:signal transduction histidine kinase/ligand-binding sensor domain-containing protein/DNA-binding response OmpR family regulator